ncbi:mechanosensitive ion channel protein 6-like [Silene latifolia]|uniref:mechanosensitive ion channel protein 6-like n=1 Tax=Silene latifolia TaxID=37657 RepID=UPI003D77F2A3
MDHSPKKSLSFNKSSSAASSASSGHSRRPYISSSSSSYHNCDDDVADHQPILSHPHVHVIDYGDDVEFPVTMGPTSPGEVIVKIDAPHANPNEFSFIQSNNTNNGGHEPQREHSIRRQVLQGLPPLPPDALTRQSFGRNQTDIQSPDSSNINKSNVNVDGLKEVRVSFQESFNSEHGRRGSSIYSTVEEDDSGSDSPCSSNNGDDEEGRGIRNRKSSTKKKENDNGINNNNVSSSSGGEVIRCTSSTSSRRMASMTKTRSRLIDPPSTPLEQRSGLIPKSGPMNMRSGLIGKSTGIDDDEEDPFFGDDLPEEFKKGNVSVLLVVEWLILLLLVGTLICSLVIPEWRKISVWDMSLWKWQVLVIVLICGRLVSGWGIRIIVFFIERNFLLRKRVLYFVYGLKKAVQNVIWLGLVLLTWGFLFDKKVEKQAKSRPLKIVTQFLLICEIGAFIWLVKTLLVKVCASFFHVNAFFDRIQESLFNQFVIETLSGPPVFDLQSPQEEDMRTMNEVQKIVQTTGINVPPDLRASVLSHNSGTNVQASQGERMTMSVPRKSSMGQSTIMSGPMPRTRPDEGITIENLSKLNQKNVSAWNMKRLMKIVRHGFLTTLDEQIVDATNNQEDETSTQIRSEVEAKAAAKKIFRNVARPRAKYICLSDLMRFMREDEAVKTMSLFEGAAETERISKSALKNWVVNAFRERRAIALTLSDTKTAVNKLHKVVDVIVFIIILLIGITLLDIITYKNIIFLSSQIVLVAFIFGNTLKNAFESIIFLFVIHPFDVGDRCEIDGVQMVVEEMNILTTVFLRFDNTKIFFPNYILLTKPISNYYRSPDMGDGIEFLFHIATPPEKIALMRQRITSYIVNKKEHWYPEPMIIVKDAENLHTFKIAVWLQHRMNHQDIGEKWVRRGILIEECIKIFRELDLEYRIYPVNVNVNAMPPLTHANQPWPNRTNVPSAEVVHS